MNKSFIDRIFPRPASSQSFQYEQSQSLTRSRPVSKSSRSPPRIVMQEDAVLSSASTHGLESPIQIGSDASTHLDGKHKSLHSAPISASVLHHDDPFLPVERAARVLQETIQGLLDVQARVLNGRANGVESDEVMSTGSLTPTQSVVTPRSSSGMRTVPIRQPLRRKIGLRGARKGLVKKMHEFAGLRQEELRILDAQSTIRTAAIQRVQDLEAKRTACVAEIDSIRRENTSATVSKLRSEAKNVQSEIEELEHKLLELRVRQTHLIGQADQLESSQESKVSSFQGTVALVDREAREFLRRPPVSHPLIENSTGSVGMYALKPDRRTLEMAREQWSSEQDLLAQRKVEVQSELTALIEGERIWSEAVTIIDNLERNLRQQTLQLMDSNSDNANVSMSSVLSELDKVIDHLESDLAIAESSNWNLLICALGAELEAFHQARTMLGHTQHLASDSPSKVTKDHPTILDVPSPHNTVPGHESSSPHGSEASDQSLKDTLNEFSDGTKNNDVNMGGNNTRYESEDDEPPADFLFSR